MSAVSWVPVISSVILALFFGAVLASEEKSTPVKQQATATGTASDKNDGDKIQTATNKVPEIKKVQDAVDALTNLLRSAQMVKDDMKKMEIRVAAKSIMSKVRTLKGENQTQAKELNQKIISALEGEDITKLTYDQLMDSLGKKLKKAQEIKAGSGTPQEKIAKIKNLNHSQYLFRVKEIEKNNPSKIQAAEKVNNDIRAIRKDLGDTTIGNKFAQGKGNEKKNAQGKGGKRPFNQKRS